MLELKNIKKDYKTGEFTQHALKGVNLGFRKNEFVAILGPSGSGKTTLLNIIGGLDRYTSGDLIINGKSTKKFSSNEWDAYRNNCIGFIFQSYNLISHISVLENVEMGMTLSGVSSSKRKKKALEVLNKVGLKEHAYKKPNQLSGGQMQRVAIARALANDPDIILADEPTGALDTKTSVQIMELIKKIAKDKLVIMVTHNPELAENYASRIIEFKDGDLISDSNPISNEENTKTFSIKKTSMNFLTALKLSFNNIKTKKGRTFITSLASSIGIIGIALILALSNGFKIQIDKFERDTLSQMPIVISPTVMTTDEEAQKEFMNQYMNNSETAFTDKKKIYPLISIDSITHNNNINLDYTNYIENVDQSLISGISYTRATKLNILYKNNDKVSLLDTTNNTILFPLPETKEETQDSVITNNFDLIYGSMAKENNELMLLIDTNNRLDINLLKVLGYTENDIVSFDDILNKEFKIVLNDELYQNIGNIFIMNTDFDSMYNSDNTITLKITGILRGKEDNTFAKYSGTGLCYKESLMSLIIEKNNESNIVKTLKEVDYNVLTGEKIDLTTDEGNETKKTLLTYLGAESAPYLIQIYPKDFNSKDELTNYLNKYNENLNSDEQIIYTDYAESITTLSGGIMDAITVVLISFSAISLIVSSIMIGIIMYISVLERTKEIGILRSLGARKKDITRVFNAETFIIGLFSGTLGIVIALILCIPANMIIESLTTLKNVAVLNPLHAVVLIIISLTLTLIGGYIPAKIASKRNPVESLRTE